MRNRDYDSHESHSFGPSGQVNCRFDETGPAPKPMPNYSLKIYTLILTAHLHFVKNPFQKFLDLVFPKSRNVISNQERAVPTQEQPFYQ